jgi:hypothetical protein
MTGRLASKVVVVTGGGTGIGRAVAGQAVADGAAVVIGGRRKDVGERAATELRGSGGRALFVASDVTVEADVARLVEGAVREFGRLDGAFNNAGGVAASRVPGVVSGSTRWSPARRSPLVPAPAGRTGGGRPAGPGTESHRPGGGPGGDRFVRGVPAQRRGRLHHRRRPGDRRWFHRPVTAPAGPALPAGGKLVQRPGRASRRPCRHPDEKE